MTAADCTVTLHDAVITGNSVSSYGSVGGSSSATNFNVYLSGNTQITGNKYGSTACNLKTSANMTVDVTAVSYTHLDVYKRQIVDRMLREFKVEASVGKPQVSYRETMTKPVDVEGKYVRQSGGKGQYGHCKIHVEPLEPGSGYIFESKIVGGSIPKEYIPSIDNGIQEAAKSGLIGGFEVMDFKVTLVDGSYHEVDSSEMAFKIAGSMAIKEAFAKGGSILLEPMMKVAVVVPEEYLGDVMGLSLIHI